MSNPKAARELAVFRQFADAAKLLAQGAMVESRRPPEPDILVREPSGAQVAFELVEILDQGYSAALQKEFDTMRVLNDAIDRLPVPDRDRFRQEFSNAHISVSFGYGATTQMRANLAPRLLALLLGSSPGFTGDVVLTDGRVRKYVQSARVDRLDIAGPLFAASTGTWVGEPTAETIESKLGKTYKTLAPMRLLAYISGNPMFPESVWKPKLETLLHGLDQGCQFDHIYVFDTRDNEVKVHWARVP